MWILCCQVALGLCLGHLCQSQRDSSWPDMATYWRRNHFQENSELSFLEIFPWLSEPGLNIQTIWGTLDLNTPVSVSCIFPFHKLKNILVHLRCIFIDFTHFEQRFFIFSSFKKTCLPLDWVQARKESVTLEMTAAILWALVVLSEPQAHPTQPLTHYPASQAHPAQPLTCYPASAKLCSSQVQKPCLLPSLLTACFPCRMYLCVQAGLQSGHLSPLCFDGISCVWWLSICLFLDDDGDSGVHYVSEQPRNTLVCWSCGWHHSSFST